MNLDKYFRCYATIDLDNIRKNAENLKAKLKDDTGMLGVIKTDAYGHGAVPVFEADLLPGGYGAAGGLSPSEGTEQYRAGGTARCRRLCSGL